MVWNFFSLMFSVFETMAVYAMNDADFQRANAGDMKKYKTTALIPQYSLSMLTVCTDSSVNCVKSLLFDSLCLCNYCCS